MKKSNDILTWDILIKLAENINMKMEYEQEALSDDHPDSTCAAHHKGAISAYGHILKRINELINS